MCVLISLRFLFQTFLVLRRNELDIFINVHTSSCKMPVIFVGFWWNLNLLDRFSKKVSNMIFHENPSSVSRVVPWGQTDSWTDMMKLTVAICNFENAPKINFYLIIIFQIEAPHEYKTMIKHSVGMFSRTRLSLWLNCARFDWQRWHPYSETALLYRVFPNNEEG